MSTIYVVEIYNTSEDYVTEIKSFRSLSGAINYVKEFFLDNITEHVDEDRDDFDEAVEALTNRLEEELNNVKRSMLEKGYDQHYTNEISDINKVKFYKTTLED